jgi:protein-S-isoprenylcysteine O-methyltransferase Ste14
MNKNRRLLHWAFSAAVLATILLGGAGLKGVVKLWPYWAVYVGLRFVELIFTPACLNQERRTPGPGGIDPGTRLLASTLFVAAVALAALDSGRFHLTEAVPEWIRFAALALFTASGVLQVWAMTVNPFFSTNVRIQFEHGHQLVRCGPYRFARHPGYLAMLLSVPASAVALGSWVALVPALCYSTLILRRTLREDCFLKENLDGYADYAANIRSRLAPGVW